MLKQTVFAICSALLLTLPVRAEEPPPLELAPLVPPKPPWLRKNQAPAKKTPGNAQAKKTRRKKGAPRPDAPAASPLSAAPPAGAAAVPPAGAPQAPGSPSAGKAAPDVAQPPKQVPSQQPAARSQASQGQPAAEIPLALPLAPLLPAPAPAIAVSNVGVLLEAGDLDPASAARVEEGLRGVVRSAPLARLGPALALSPAPCSDDACLSSQASLQGIDQLLVATYAGGGLRVRLVDVAGRKTAAEAAQAAVPRDPRQAAAAGEALACKILVPAGCTREGAPELFAAGSGSAMPRQPESKPAAARPVPTAALAAAQPGPGPRRFTRPAGIAALGAAAVAAGAGAYFGLKSRSDLNQVESDFHKNGAYRTSDLSTLTAGNSAAHSANALFIASGALLAAGAILTWAF